MIHDEIPLWGLTERSSIPEIMEKSFQFLRQQGGRVSISTLKHGLPENRIISLQRLSDGELYFMTSRGKPFYRQLQEQPHVAIASLLDDTHHCIRIRAAVEECTDPAVYRDYAEKNPGTMKMYRYNTDLIVLFRLARGTGEILHLYRDDMIRRLRFGFGGERPEELTYFITERCTGCGSCFDHCAEHSIYRSEDGKYHIRSMDCDDCGICYTKCPLAGTALINRMEENRS